ncbi:unnamed protein product, partial [Brenthis ino]
MNNLVIECTVDNSTKSTLNEWACARVALHSVTLPRYCLSNAVGGHSTGQCIDFDGESDLRKSSKENYTVISKYK